MAYRVGILTKNLAGERRQVEVESFTIQSASRALNAWARNYKEFPEPDTILNLWIRDAPPAPKGYSVPGEI